MNQAAENAGACDLSEESDDSSIDCDASDKETLNNTTEDCLLSTALVGLRIATYTRWTMGRSFYLCRMRHCTGTVGSD